VFRGGESAPLAASCRCKSPSCCAKPSLQLVGSKENQLLDLDLDVGTADGLMKAAQFATTTATSISPFVVPGKEILVVVRKKKINHSTMLLET
jgi:hypothetical protein